MTPSSVLSFLKSKLETSKMAQWVKVLVAKPDNLSSVSGTHVVEGKILLQIIF